MAKNRKTKPAGAAKSRSKTPAGRSKKRETKLADSAAFVVSGRIRDTDDRPVAGVLVRAYDQDLRKSQLLGDDWTDELGHYRIPYRRTAFCRADKENADLYTVVVSADERELLRSSVLFNALAETQIDHVIAGVENRESEYEHVLKAIRPLLAGQGERGQDLPVTELTDKDILFLTQDTGVASEQIALLVKAHQSAATVRPDKTASTHRGRSDDQAVPAELYYGWFRQGVPTEPKALWSTKPDDLIAAFTAAIQRNIVPQRLREWLDKLSALVEAMNVSTALQPAADGHRASLGDLLATIPGRLSTKKERLAAGALLDTGLTEASFAGRLRDAGFSAGEIASVQVTRALGDLTGGNRTLVQELQALRGTTSDPSLRFLAPVPPARWLELAVKHRSDGPLGTSPEIHAEELERAVEAQHPTAVLAARIQSGHVELHDAALKAAAALLASNPELELQERNARAVVDRLEGVKDKERLVSNLQKIQRAQRLAGGWREAGLLLDKGLGTARTIVQLGPKAFQESVGPALSSERAAAIYAQAQRTHDTAVALIAMAYADRGAVLGFTAAGENEPDSPDTSNYPNLRRLFGNLTTCECAHCQSVLSPAAYLVDLLRFLDPQSDATRTVTPALSTLLARRPDIADIELTCRNTTQEVPYIDLVLEVLENAIGLPIEISAPYGFDPQADLALNPLPSRVMTALRSVLERSAISIDEPLRIERSARQLLIGTFTDWMITDGARYWTLRHFPRSLTLWRLGIIPKVLDVTDYEAVRLQLDQGQLPNVDWVIPSDGSSRDGNLPLTGTPAVTPVQAGVRWTVTYTRAVRVTFTMAAPMSAIILRSADGGRQLDAGQYPTAMAQMVFVGLRSGQIVEPLRSMLPEGLPYRIAQAGADWEITVADEVTLRFVPERLFIASLTYQTSDAREDALASPENRNPEAYNRLDGTVYPWTLPFNLWLEEVRTFLDRGGVSRRRLMERCKPATRLADHAIAREVLGLSLAEANIVTATNPRPQWEYWGLLENGNRIVDRNEEHLIASGSWTDVLNFNVSMLLQQSGLSYRELLNVLQTRFVRAVAPVLTPVGGECNPSAMRLPGLTAAHLDRIHRFVRLWKKTGGSPFELDLAIAATPVDRTSLNETALLRLSHLRQLHELLDLPVSDLAGWWGSLTESYDDFTAATRRPVKSLYERLFLNPAVANPPDHDFSLNDQRSEIAYQTPGTPPALASKAAAVTAALGIPRPDFDALVEHLLAQQELDDPPSLTLKNLGVLIRNVSMAKALRLSIADFIRLKRVTGIDPFSSPAQAITFVEQAQVIAKSGFPIETLQYLLQYALGDEPNPLLPVEWLSGTMASLREDLQVVQHDVAGADRPGETLAKVLAGLGWYDELVKEAVDLLGLSDRLTVTVPGSPAVVVPPALAGFVVYRRADGLLIGSPALSANQWNAFDLANAALPPARVAITLLRAKIDAFMVALPALAHRLQSFELPVFRVAYIQPPPAIPKNLSRRCYFDKGSKEIVFVGWMSDDQQAEFAAVLSLPVAAALKAKSDQYAETVPLNRFFPAESDIRALFAVDQAPETRVEQVLQRLLPYLRRKAAAESLAQALELDRTLVDGLLSTGLDRVSTLEALVDDEFANSDARVTPTPATFPRQARALCKLHKAALVYRTVKLRPDEVSWLPPAVLQSIAFDVPPLDAFPSATGDADVPYDAWRRLAQLFELRERPSVGSKLIARLHSLMAVEPATLVEVQADATAQIAYLAAGLDSSVDDLSWAAQTRLNLQWPADYQSAVRIAAVIAWLAKWTLASAMRVSADDVTDAMTKLNVAWPAELRNPLRLDALLQLLSTVRKLGGKASECFALAEDTAPAPGVLARPGPSEVKVARGLLRARSEGHTWLQRLRPISDGLRHKQRDALVAYLIANPPANAVAKGLWKDANDLYEHFLIDPHMSACKVSTRILHAISAVQLFVQRCLMNLEDGVSPASINAERWRWMKNYRVWEANRKVFLYPENWIEPELRDDKSELFMELEGQLQQSEFDNERAEELLKVYLKQLEDISSLAVVGMYVDNEASEGEPEVRIHVLGRTRNRPSRFYYRRWVLTQRTNRWEPWEHVALEGVKSDHVLPFVMRGDVYIAWPEITQLAAEPGVGGATAPGAKWRVQMAWIRRTTRGWTDRLMGSDVFEHPWVYGKDENQTFTFRVRNSVPGSMDIDCYGAKREGELLYDAPSTADINPFRTFFLMIPSAPWITVAVSGVVYASYANGTVFRPLGNASVRVYVKLNGTPDEITTATNDVKWDEEHGLGLSGAPAYRSTVDTSTVTDANGNFTLTLSLAAWLYGSDLFGNHDVGYYRQSVLKTNPTFELSVSFGSAPSQSKSFPYKDSSSNEVYQHHSRLSFQQNFIIGIGGAAPGGDADRPVSIVPIRKFRIYAADDAEWLPLATPLPAPPSGALTYGSGFKFTGANQSSALTLSGAGGGNAATVWTGVSPSYSLLPAAPFESQAAEVVVYRDPQNSYFIRWENTNADPAGSQGRLQIVVNGHPRAGELRREVSIGGVPKLFELIQQTWQHAANFDIHTPGSSVDLDRSLPRPAIYFEPEQAHSPYAGYNTELFFHLPMLVAGFLSSNQRFADAQQWLHFIFDPTTEDAVNGNQRYWRYLPFRTQSMTTPIEELLALLGDSGVPATDGRKQQITAQIDVWSKNPFRPHAVARMRPRAYQINVVFKYLDNLIAWGDSLFRQYTTESVNEATQLYVLAAKLLGPRPQSIPRARQPQPLTYRRANDRWDEFSNAWLELESNLPTGGRIAGSWGMSMHGDKGLSTISSVGLLYFCVPRNEKLAVYWDKVDERLFNIRHCRNIDGAEQPLPLFQPPIDPALLVRATAAGLDIGAVLAEAAAPIPYYRFGVVMGKAMDLCNEVRGLGGALLAALEKKDAEQLSRLRSNQEMDVLNLVSAVKEAQIAEANANIDALRQSEQAATARFTQYQRLLGNNSAQVPDDFGADVEQTSAVAVAKADSSSELTNLGLTQAELDQIGWSDTAMTYATVAGAFNTASGILFAFPDISAGTPFFQSKFGGTNLGYVANAIGSFFSILERNAVHQSSRSAAIGQYQRRQDEWVFQSRMALKEIQQIRRQIIASTIRADIAAKELDNHKKQIEQAEETDRFMRDKYTNQELYHWMTQQLSGVYFRAYQIAYDCAKRAERAFQFELGLRQSSYIQFGYWDSLKKGLLSGERLGQDLRRMDVAYLDQNKREYEITKHVSLLQLDPLALVVLRESGRCEFAVPEAWFDMDYPGHYMRRLKSVSVTIPCVVGPYATVSCTVTLLKSQIRHSNSLDGGYGRDAQQDDPRFSDLFGPMQSMVTSGGQSDSGMFETNLRDERYLPFEGAGAVSSWRLELPTDFKTFDHDSISDVILHLRYTAREGGEGLRAAAAGDLQTAVNEMVANEGGKGVTRLFSLRHEFPTEWQRFLNVAAEGTGDHKQALSFGPERFPFFLRDRFAAGKVKVSKVHLFSTFTRKPADDGALYLTPPGNAFDEQEDRIDLSARDEYGDALYGQRSFQQPKTVGTWTVLATAADFDALKNESGDVLLRDVFVCFELTIA
ncbi:protein of unknown function [Nitrospira japonica]|uniref:Virulence plasmid A protein n=1 Tax=Nitrospira japonica TaxID=1325564 RepID=A0A1W1I6Y1_9BACT|nr:neuraminidase-like domain-containing protein [Nitrospira japonica]SLM48754.1 protein of unknown function [Nitrospira japonica]